ncbi:MAG: helix-turn-helix domain-containing protein [Proteobacteria bacterium]|nr:helix-turn-helix domain-containing protein [Pseudomonadota bacterium]
MNDLLGHFIFFSMLFSLVNAVYQLQIRKKAQGNIVFVILFFHIFIWQLLIWFLHSDLFEGHVILIFPEILQFFGGPILYLFYNKLIDPAYSIRLKHSIHFIPGFLVMIAMVTAYLLVDKFYLILRFYKNYLSSTPEVYFVIAVIFIGPLSIFCYLLAVMWKNRNKLFKKGWSQNTETVIKVTLFQVLYVEVMVVYAIVIKTTTGHIFPSLSIFLTPYLILIFYTSLLYPYYHEILKTSANETPNKKRYVQSRVESLDTDDIILKLNQLMIEEKSYQDENLTLPKLAQKLAISHHQLSEVLNKNLEQSFHDFINNARIEESKKLLINEPKSSVLSIAYAVGFNSRSSFYNAFKKASGLTPSDFRKSLLTYKKS